MIKIEHTVVYGWEAAIRGMRNPFENHDNSDSGYCSEIECDDCPFNDDEDGCRGADYIIGPSDLNLMTRLVSAGTDHSKFMRMIDVTADVIAPLYWWKEMDTYKVGTVANSCSTMHTIHKKAFTLDDFSHEHLKSGGIECIDHLCKDLNMCRQYFIETNDKEWWWQIIQILPSSYNQRRTIHLNYAVLRNIYHARNDHKLDEWRDFCRWIECLPYSELITGVGRDG